MKTLATLFCMLTVAPFLSSATEFKYAPASKVIGSKLVVPIDIEKIDAQLEYNESSLQAKTESKVIFNLKESGFPFLILKRTSEVFIDGKPVKMFALPKPYQANMFALDISLTAGLHSMKVINSYTPNAKVATFLSVPYWEGSFIEDLFPCNTLNDHFQLSLYFKVISEKSYELITNAEKVVNIGSNSFVLTFPESFTSSSFQIDLIKTKDLIKSEVNLRSIDGRTIPLLVYSTKEDSGSHLIPSFMNKTEKALSLLESKLGAFPFSRIILKSTDKLNEGAFAGEVTPKFRPERS